MRERGRQNQSLARMEVKAFAASTALNFAAPVELAVASLADRAFLGVVAAATTQQITAIYARRSPIASSSACACR